MIKDQFPVFAISQLDDFKQDDLMISRLSPYLAVHKNLQRAHKHSFYHLVLFTEGGGSQTIDFQRFEVRPYQFYFMIPGQVHHWSFEGPVNGYVVNFSTLFFQSFLLKSDYFEQYNFFNGNAEEAVIDIPHELQTDAVALFEKLLKEHAERQLDALDMIRLLLMELFILIGRLSAPHEQKHISPYNLTLLKNFRQLIENHFANLKLPKEYAALLYITPNHLNALCNDTLGVAAGEVIRNRVVLEAKRLLVNPELGITEIAVKLNFTDNSYFTKFFKKQAGLTPEEFRKQFITKR